MNVPRVWATVMTLLLSLRGVCGQSNWIQSLFFKDTQSKSMTRGSRRRMSMVNPSTEYSQPITDDAPMSTSAPSLVTTSRPKKTKSTGGSSMSNSTMNSTASDMKSSNTTTIPSSTSIKNSTSSKTTPSTAISSKQSDPGELQVTIFAAFLHLRG